MSTWPKPFFFRFVQILSAGENKGRKHSLLDSIACHLSGGDLKLEKPVTGNWPLDPFTAAEERMGQVKEDTFVSDSYLFIYTCCSFIPMGMMVRERGHIAA